MSQIYTRIFIPYGPAERGFRPNLFGVRLRALLTQTAPGVTIDNGFSPNPFVQTYKRSGLLTTEKWFAAVSAVFSVSGDLDAARVLLVVARAFKEAGAGSHVDDVGLAGAMLSSRNANNLESDDAWMVSGAPASTMTLWQPDRDGFERWEHTSEDGRSLAQSSTNGLPGVGVLNPPGQTNYEGVAAKVANLQPGGTVPQPPAGTGSGTTPLVAASMVGVALVGLTALGVWWATGRKPARG